MNNKIKFILGLVILGLFSLGSCKKSAPVGVISEDTIQMILFDLYIYEGVASVEHLDMGDSAKIPGYNSVLAKYNTTMSDFDSSMVYYAKNMPKLKLMHEKVLDRLDKYKEELEKSEK